MRFTHSRKLVQDATFPPPSLSENFLAQLDMFGDYGDQEDATPRPSHPEHNTSAKLGAPNANTIEEKRGQASKICEFIPAFLQ